jgi:pseudouridine-5'-phosphate glycosidase
LRTQFRTRILACQFRLADHDPMTSPVDISRAVSEALAYNRPVVALETTVLSHGLPWPENLEAAQAMERAVGEGGAAPAFIGILDGRIRIGLEAGEIERFARGDDIVKASRRDLGPLVARGASAATTVAATMVCAHLAGIAVFSTGGIGGVHRGAAHTFDVSADLHELARTPVAVVCSGAKSILDLPATLEMLETHAVPVIGYGVDELPAFHARQSGLALELVAETPREAARMVASHWTLGGAGVVLANPVPEHAAIPADEIEEWLREALADAEREAIRGKAVTPYLLTRLATASGGLTLETNVALLGANAALAARLAAALVDTDGQAAS